MADVDVLIVIGEAGILVSTSSTIIGDDSFFLPRFTGDFDVADFADQETKNNTI